MAETAALDTVVPEVTPDMDMVRDFFNALYAHVPAGALNLRAVPEPRDGRPTRNSHCDLDFSFFDNIERFVRDCAVNSCAAFFIPGTVGPGGTKQKDVLSLPAVLVDLDRGEPDKNLAAIEALIGPATVVVESGGVTKDGHKKLHAHWRLQAAATGSDVERVCQVREALAQRFDGDPAFKQSAQPVRIGGAVHHKHGAVLSRVRVVRPDAEYALDDICRAIGAAAEPPSNVIPFDWDFSKVRLTPAVDELRDMAVVETGGGSGVTRFEWFSRVGGAEIADVWHGRKSLEDAVVYMKGKVAGRFDKPEDWDDARVEHEMHALWEVQVAHHGAPPAVQARQAAAEWANFDQWTGDKFDGVPVPRKFLIDGVLPLGVVGILGAQGGLGKSFLMLDLAYRIATGERVEGHDYRTPQLILGGEVKEFGTAAVFFAEDDKQTVHERLVALDRDSKRRTPRLRPIPLPNAGGPRALFAADRDGYKTTAAYEAVRTWLKSLPDLRLVCFDPLQTLVAADITSKPEAGQFVMSTLGALATELGATVLVTHHMKKTPDRIGTPEEARAAMRGTTALVDGVRWAYALWDTPGDAEAPAAGAVVKSNGKSDMTVHRYARLPCGVLRQLQPAFDPEAREERLKALVGAVAAEAARGYPFTLSGENGLHSQQHRLPPPFRTMAREKLEALGKQALNEGRLVKGTAGASKKRALLDVPNGSFALGHGVVMSGAADAVG
jgi:hypothetical protein